MRIESSCLPYAMGSLRGSDERAVVGRYGRHAAGNAESGEPEAHGPGGDARRVENLVLDQYRPGRMALTLELLEQASAAVFMELASPSRPQPGDNLDRQV